MTPIDLTIAHLIGKPSNLVRWTLNAGELAKQLNRESEFDILRERGGEQKAASNDHGRS